MSCDLGNKNSDIIGVLEETTFRTPVVTTFDAGELVNPIYANSFEDNTNAEKGYTMSLRARYGRNPKDFTKGRSTYDLTITGDLRVNGYDFILGMFESERSYSVDHMVYKTEDADTNCINRSYTFWIPREVNGTRKAVRLEGSIPLTLEENYIEGTFTATFTCSKKQDLTVANTIPTFPDDYRTNDELGGNDYDVANIQKTIGRLWFNGNELATDSLTYTIEFALNEENGQFDGTGYRTDFNVGTMTTNVNYVSPLADAATTRNISRTLLDDRENNTSRDFEIRLTADATHKIIKTFSGICQNEAENKAAAEFYTFTTDILPTSEGDTDVTTQIYGDYGDLTTKF